MFRYLIYSEGGELVAGTAYGEDAAAMVAIFGDDAWVEVNGKTVWTEGMEAFPAGESYDRAASIMNKRAV